MNKTFFLAAGVAAALIFAGEADISAQARGPRMMGRMPEMRSPDVFPHDRGPRMMGRMSNMQSIVRTLEEAGCPLTDEQLVSIRETLRSRGMWAGITDILTPEQAQALEDAQRERADALEERFNNMRKVRLERQIDQITRILDEAGCPLTDEQREQLKAVDPGTRIGSSLVDILTDEQQATLWDARPQPPNQPFDRNRDFPRPDFRGPRPFRPGWFGASEGVVPPPGLDIDPEGIEKDTGMAEEPIAFTGISQNFPNPFNPATTVEYSLAEPGNVRLEIYNGNGQRIETLVDGWQGAGTHSVLWDASSQANGVYFCRITAGTVRDTRKMLYVK
ncbi:T9SS type A sorting domain-containing protein [Candidatus Latescibacterota bacterium]